MAILNSTVINGSLNITNDTDVSNGKLKLKIINAPTSSGGTTYGPGTSGQVLKSNGTSMYWASDSSPSTYLKSASVSGNTLTLTKQDNSTVTYTPSLSNYISTTDTLIDGKLILGNGSKTAKISTVGVSDIALTADLPVVEVSETAYPSPAVTILGISIDGDEYNFGGGTVKSVNNVSPDSNGNVSLTLPPTITINTTNKTISDGTNTLTFGSNAFNSTTIPTSYVASSSYNSSTKVLTITPNSGSATTVTFGSNAFTSTTIPTTYVSTVNGSSGAITNVAKTNSANTFSSTNTFTNTVTISDGAATGATITGGNYLTITNNLAGVQFIGQGETFQVGTSSNKWYLSVNGSTGTSGQVLTIDSNGKPNWAAASGPSTYLKTASTSNNTLTLTKQDNTTVTFSPVAIDASVASNTLIFANTGASNYGNIALVTTTATSQELSPNVFYQWSTSGFSSNITVTFGSAISGIVNEYMWEVTTGGTAITITTPSSVIWADDSNVTKSSNVLTLATNCAYQFSVVNNLGLISSFPVSGTRSLNVQQNGSNLSWGDGNEQR